jgi:hypothetical protein
VDQALRSSPEASRLPAGRRQHIPLPPKTLLEWKRGGKNGAARQISKVLERGR